MFHSEIIWNESYIFLMDILAIRLLTTNLHHHLYIIHQRTICLYWYCTDNQSLYFIFYLRCFFWWVHLSS